MDFLEECKKYKDRRFVYHERGMKSRIVNEGDIVKGTGKYYQGQIGFIVLDGERVGETAGIIDVNALEEIK